MIYESNPHLGKTYFYVTPTQPIKVREVVCIQSFGITSIDEGGNTTFVLDRVLDVDTKEEFSYVLLHGKTMLLNSMDDAVEVLCIVYNNNPLGENTCILNEIHEFLLSTKKTNPEFFL
jgi:hypothetical protein